MSSVLHPCYWTTDTTETRVLLAGKCGGILWTGWLLWWCWMPSSACSRTLLRNRVACWAFYNFLWNSPLLSVGFVCQVSQLLGGHTPWADQDPQVLAHTGVQAPEKQSLESEIFFHSWLISCPEVGLSELVVVSLWGF